MAEGFADSGVHCRKQKLHTDIFVSFVGNSKWCGTASSAAPWRIEYIRTIVQPLRAVRPIYIGRVYR